MDPRLKQQYLLYLQQQQQRHGASHQHPNPSQSHPSPSSNHIQSRVPQVCVTACDQNDTEVSTVFFTVFQIRWSIFRYGKTPLYHHTIISHFSESYFKISLFSISKLFIYPFCVLNRKTVVTTIPYFCTENIFRI